MLIKIAVKNLPSVNLGQLSFNRDGYMLVFSGLLFLTAFMVVAVLLSPGGFMQTFRQITKNPRIGDNDVPVLKTVITQRETENDMGVSKHAQSVKQYFLAKENLTNHFDQRFLLQSGEVCSEHEEPFLVIICLSQYDRVPERKTIRNTWGSAVRTRIWPNSKWTSKANIKMFFIIGHQKKHTASAIQKLVEHEMLTFQDIVFVDMDDCYSNLSTKVILGLKWVQTFCPRTRFILKVDEDTFIHVPNLIKLLNKVTIPEEGFIGGHVIIAPKAIRNKASKWFISKEVYPFYRYPPYTTGQTYVISGNAISRLIITAEHMPYFGIEDAFITGVLRTVIGTRLQYWNGFPRLRDSRPKPCMFHNSILIGVTNTNNTLKLDIWNSLFFTLPNCYKPYIVKVSNKTLAELLTDTRNKT